MLALKNLLIYLINKVAVVSEQRSGDSNVQIQSNGETKIRSYNSMGSGCSILKDVSIIWCGK